jgi:hypothetical protein
LAALNTDELPATPLKLITATLAPRSAAQVRPAAMLLQ